MKFSLFFFVLFSSSLLLKGQSAAPIIIEKDLVYGHAGDVALKMDIGMPEGAGPFPVILFFHGGGWQQGDKWHMHKWIQKFAAAGYVGVSAEYRFAPRFKWPAQVHDAKQAVRYLRANAPKYNIDTSRIGVMGESAGGYLALMLGVTSPKDSLEGETDLPGYSSRVKAVVSYFSATDFTFPRMTLSPDIGKDVQEYYGKSLDQVLKDFTGASGPADPVLKKISPVTYVDSGDAPALLFQGDSDPFVSINHAYKMHELLEKANVPNQLVIVPGGGHGWTGTLEEKTTRQMFDFFDRILKNR